MASDDNPRQPLIDPSTSTDSPHLKYTESVPSTTIDMTSNLTSSKKKKSPLNIKVIRRKMTNRQSSVKDLFMINLSHRLASRKVIQTRLSSLTDIMCLLALLGIILMIIENEIKFAQIYNQETPASWALKLIITISTIFLVALVFIYHRLDLNLYAINHSTDNWRIGLTYRKLLLIALEVIICALHPLVPAYPKESSTTTNQSILNATIVTESPPANVPPDIVLSLIMFLRLYLLCRFAVYHSQLTRNIGHQSFGYLNQVSIDFIFLVKTTLYKWPTSSLLSFLIIAWFIGSWAMRACDYDSVYVHPPMVDTMWFFIITYTTVGYGDLTPATYCGRGIAVIIAFFGLLSGALLVAVVTQKLMLDRSEKYLHNYVLNIELAKERKIQAANVVKFSTKLWRCKRTNDFLSRIKHFHTKRQLLNSIYNIQQIKQKQRDLVDTCVDLPEIAILQRSINTNTEDTMKTVVNLEYQMNNFEEEFLDVKESINSMQNTLKLLVDISTNKSVV